MRRRITRQYKKQDQPFLVAGGGFRNGSTGPKRLCRWAVVTLCLLVAVFWGGALIEDAPAFAAETEKVEVDAPMDVYLEGSLKKTYTAESFRALCETLGMEEGTYSGFNTFPTARQVDRARGITVEALLRDALGEDAFGWIGPYQVIEFTARDGTVERFTRDQLFADRMYFPGAEREQGRLGQAVLPESLAGASPVVPIISLTEEGQQYGEGGNYDVGRLLFGQISPSEQNYAAFLKELAPQKKKVLPSRADSVKHSSIVVRTGTAGQWKPIRSLSAKAGKSLVIGTTLDMDLSVNDFQTGGSGRFWVYYTTDGTRPDAGSNMYNYKTNGGAQYNPPVLDRYGTMVVKTMVRGYGKRDSKVTSFRYKVVPERPAIRKLTGKKRTVTIKWTKNEDASGYQISRSTKKKGKYKVVKTLKKASATSWKNTGLKKGKTYYYKVRTYRTVAGKKVYSSYSAVKYRKVK